jgi:hypothetical protein
MDKDKAELDEILKEAEEATGSVADRHNHGCPLGEMARDMSNTFREARVSLAGKGPAQVATDNYRKNWDGIFGAKPQWGQA